LIVVERDYKTLLEQTIQEKRQLADGIVGKISPCIDFIHSSSSEISPKPNHINNLQPPLSVVLNHENPDCDEENCQEFLTRIGCDSNTINVIQRNGYTKNDLVDFVTREEIMGLGVTGGAACLIWREILRERMELSQKVRNSSLNSIKIHNTFLSPPSMLKTNHFSSASVLPNFLKPNFSFHNNFKKPPFM
jgi:hypothetical protein